MTTLGLTYMDDLGRVRVSATGVPTDADYVSVERSTDQVTWTTVRGGLTVPVVSSACKLDDYEFTAGVANYYRVRAIDAAAVQPFGSGSNATANNATVNPVLPAGSIPDGAMMVLFASHANTAATINTPTGWTRLAGGGGNVEIFYRVKQAGDTAPAVSFSGGSAGDSCSAHIRVWTNGAPPAHVAIQSNASAQNVAYPGGALPQNGVAWVLQMWKKSFFTSGAVAPNLFGDPQGGTNSSGANTESQLTWRTDATVNIQTVVSGTSPYTGGSAAISKARLVYMTRRPWVTQNIGSITPVLDSVWIKNPSRPSLNTKVDVNEFSDIVRSARSTAHDVIGRTMPVVVSDVQSSRRLTIQITTRTQAASQDMDLRLATGEPVFLQAPSLTHDVPTMYATIGDITQSKNSHRTKWRQFTLPLIEVAAPGAVVAGSTITWQDVVNTYATWADVIAAKSTWSNLIDSVAGTGAIIVP